MVVFLCVFLIVYVKMSQIYDEKRQTLDKPISNVVSLHRISKTTIMNEPNFLQPNHYEPKSKNVDTPRGIRNCNPLNIRINAHNNWIGKYPKEHNNDGEFEQFQFMYQGFLAALKLIGNTYILRYKLNTLSAIINRWAPKEDGNDPQGYLEKVCAWTGIGGREPISNHDPRLKNIVMAMAIVECGPQIKTYNAALNEAFEQFKPKFPKMERFEKKHHESNAE